MPLGIPFLFIWDFYLFIHSSWEMEYFQPYQWTRVLWPGTPAITDGELVSPEGTRKQRIPAIWQTSDSKAITPFHEPWGSSGCENKILAPESWGAHPRNCFSESRLLHPPIHRKVLSPTTLDIWFSLTIIFCCSWLPALYCKTSCNLAPLLASLEQISQGCLRCCLPAWSPKNSHQIKHNSRLLSCGYFFKSTVSYI